MKLSRGLGGLGPIALVISAIMSTVVAIKADDVQRIDIDSVLNVAEVIADQAASHLAQGATIVANSIGTDTVINGIGNVAVTVAGGGDASSVLNVIDNVVSGALAQVPGGQALQVAQQTIIAPASPVPTPQEIAQAVVEIAQDVASVAKPAVSNALHLTFVASHALISLLKDLINPQKIYSFAKEELVKMYQIIAARLALAKQK